MFFFRVIAILLYQRQSNWQVSMFLNAPTPFSCTNHQVKFLSVFAVLLLFQVFQIMKDFRSFLGCINKLNQKFHIKVKCFKGIHNNFVLKKILEASLCFLLILSSSKLVSLLIPMINFLLSQTSIFLFVMQFKGLRLDVLRPHSNFNCNH